MLLHRTILSLLEPKTSPRDEPLLGQAQAETEVRVGRVNPSPRGQRSMSR
jgi:hypothetical protein